jgi:DNA polymerase-4
MDKPNGITLVPLGAEAIIAWLAPLPARRMWGVGAKSEELLMAQGIKTIGDMQKLTVAELRHLFGAWGDSLYDLCRGIDERPVVVAPEDAKSISRETTFGEDTTDRDLLERTLLTLSQDVARQARQAGLKGRTVALNYRLWDFNRHSRRRTLSAPTDLGKRIYEEVRDLLQHIPVATRVRLIGVGLTGFAESEQLDLFAGATAQEEWETSERTIDKIEEKYGEGVVRRGREVGTPRRGPTDHYR